MVWSKPQFFKKATYQFRGWIPLNTCLVNSLSDNECSFELVRIDSEKKKYILCASNWNEKNVWVADLNKLIDIWLKKAKVIQ